MIGIFKSDIGSLEIDNSAIGAIAQWCHLSSSNQILEKFHSFLLGELIVSCLGASRSLLQLQASHPHTTVFQAVSKETRAKKGFVVSDQGRQSFPEALFRLPHSFHYPELDHMPTHRPVML